MDLQFFQSWRHKDAAGAKAWYGFLALTDTEVITFLARGKHGEPLVRVSADRPSAGVATMVARALESGKVSRVKRFQRTKIASITAVPSAKRLAISMHDGEQHKGVVIYTLQCCAAEEG